MKALRTYVSIFSVLFCALSFSEVSRQVDETFNLKAEAGKTFAADLREYTQVEGEYSVLVGPEWLEVASNGISFGTPSADKLGTHKLYVSVLTGIEERVFLFVIEVLEETPSNVLKFHAKVGEVFMVRLAEKLQMEGSFSYDGLPHWLEGLEDGVLVGAPEKSDVGSFEFEIFVQNNDKQLLFKAQLVVVGNSTGVPAYVKVGEKVSVDLYKMTGGKNGKYHVRFPKFLDLSEDAILSGIPTLEDVGTHRIWLRVEQLLTNYNYYFDLVVEK